jgi:hypothetical protein
MARGISVLPIGLALLILAPTTAPAAQACLANGKSFKVGEVACLTVADESQLARCEMVLNNTSWTRLGDSCTAGTPAPPVQMQPTPAPSPSLVPTEPTEN